MSRARLVVAGALAVGVLAAATGCGAGEAPAPVAADPVATPASVDVDTPALRAQKAAAGIAACPASEGDPAPSGGLPALTLPCLGGGRPVDLARLTGMPTLVNVWAQWCAPCRAEAPAFQQVHEAYGPRLQVIGIDWQDTQPDAALAFAEELGLTYPQLADPEGVTRAPLSILGPPTTFFVAADGTVAHVESGPVTRASELTHLVEQHLGVSP